MRMQEALPERVLEFMRSGTIAEYATVSAAGVPIDTAVLYFPSAGLQSFDLATGLSYPAKAERARRNPKVGLLLEGAADEPVVSIAGRAAVRDADLQSNVLRYLAEAAHTLPFNPGWELARQAVWYWTRIIVEITPARVLWWDSPAELDRPPQRWDAPPDTIFPPSDPAPPGTVSKPAQWKERPWRDLAAAALERKARGHLSVLDEDGYPLPMRARDIAIADEGFSLELPAGVPWRLAGKACLTFGGIETFIGEVESAGSKVAMRVERTLPVFPMTEDQRQLWEPTPDTREQLMRRLLQETERRNQPIPSIPLERPDPTDGYLRRMARLKRAAAAKAAGKS